MKKILIVRMSAIGDVVFASLLAKSIKLSYPNAKIYWLIEPAAKEIMECNPYLEKVIEFPKPQLSKLLKEKRLLKLIKEFFYFIKQIRAYKFDTSIDAQGLIKSAIFARLCGANKRYGFRSKEFSHLLLTDTTDKDGEKEQFASEYYHLIKFMKTDDSVLPKLHLCKRFHQKAQQLIKQHNLQNGFIAIAPFTTRPQKHWFISSWQELIFMIYDKIKLPAVILGAPNNKQDAIEIIQNSQAINLCGQTTIGEAAALISYSSLTIGVDTGLTHISIAQMRPTIALFGSTVPYLKTHNPKAKIIYHKLSCSPCRKHPTCNGSFDCMKSIKPDEVLKSAMELI